MAVAKNFPKSEAVRQLIQLARREDIGEPADDVTSRLTISPDAVGVATLLQKQVGVVAGLPIVEMICGVYDEQLRIEAIGDSIGGSIDALEGQYSDARVKPLLRIRGPLRSLLSAERVLLNFVQRLSGVATLTQRFVRKIAGTNAKIYDTRKTMPGFRALDKYAVVAGGGFNHRIGLYDGLLVKDNHLAAVPVKEITTRMQPVVSTCRSEDPNRLVELEVDTLDQLREVLKIDGVGVILLDNMDCPQMTQAVRLRDAAGLRGKVDLEASGGVMLETVREIAETGVDRISVGAITHSATALDLGLDVEG